VYPTGADARGLPGEPLLAYCCRVTRRPLSVFLALLCSAQVPTLAQASLGPSQDVDARAEALFVAGKPLEAAVLLAQALRDLPEEANTRQQRNSWAVGAVNAYRYAFELNTTECATSYDGLTVADGYLTDLVWGYGEEAKLDADYVGMRSLRDELDQLRADKGCPMMMPTVSSTRAPKPAPATEPNVKPTEGREGPAAAPSEPLGAQDPAPSSHGPGFVVGVGLSAALTAGMAIGTGVLYGRLRKDGGSDYKRVQDAAATAGVPTTDKEYDMCKDTAGNADLATACQQWNSSHKAFLATAVLTGVFAAGTAVLTGLLIRQRRQSGAATALLRRHQAQIGATPHLGGGASLTAGFQF
jgi:hypothetical protein